MIPARRHIGASIGLLFVAPMVAEFLLGNLPIKLLPALIVLAPMYGGGALLIRETARRACRGWPTMLLLGAAYTVLEEAFTTQSLFNPNYLRLNMHLLDHAFMPALGIGAWWTLLMFNLHTFWSVSVSIILVEALVPGDRMAPWLGKAGDAVVAVLFLVGVGANAAYSLKTEHFMASRTQLVVAAVVCLGLIVAAFLLPRRAASVAGAAPGPWWTGAAACVFGAGVLITPSGWGWGAVAVLLALDGAFLGLAGWFSRRVSWTPLYTFSLGAGGAMAYGLHAFIQNPVVGKELLAVRVGNVIFLAAAIALIVIGAKRTAGFESGRSA